MKNYDIQKTGENLQKESLYSVIDLSNNSVIKSELLAKDANLFIENLILLENLYDYLVKKQLDFQLLKDKLPENLQESLLHNYGHDTDALLLKLERQINALRKLENYQQAESLIKKLEKFKTAEQNPPLFKRIKRAYHLFRSI